jgi:glycosyltransferase involved in cell wall biosynthesis
MKTYKLSIIIPVYNAEKSLPNILEKLVLQTYRNIEIIVVNDGSTDGSYHIIKHYASIDDRIVAINQNNQGVSAARNSGINIVSGKYILFIDADDDLDIDLINILMSKVSSNTDLVVCGMYLNNKKIIPNNSVIDDKKRLRIYVLKSLLQKNLLYGPCCKIFRFDIIAKHHLRFPTNVNYGEDTIFVLNYMTYIRFIVNINKALYYYHYNSQGLAKSHNLDREFRSARSKSLKTFFDCGNKSIMLTVMYVLIRIRWSASYLKSIAGSFYV